MPPLEIHVFDNGLRVYRHHLIQVQRERYETKNIHEPEEEQFFVGLLDAMPEDGVLFDVGAAIGYYALLAKKLKPHLRVHAFEPLPMHQEYLLANLELNGISSNEVVLHQEALGAADGKAPFRAHHFGSRLVRPDAAATKKPGVGFLFRLFGKVPERSVDPDQITVPTMTLDTLLNRLVGVVDLAKVDVQGFELDVLRAASASLARKRVKKWLIGTHSEYLHLQCIDLLQKRGYRIAYEEQHTQ